MFRQSAGGRLTHYDSYFVLTFMQAGFIVSAGALVPYLLVLLGLSEAAAVRGASAIMGIPICLFVATVPARRRVATGGPTPTFVRILLGFQALAGVSLLLAALGTPPVPRVGLYAAALTTILVTSGIAFLLALHVMLPGLSNKP